jgi:hypothetical protein
MSAKSRDCFIGLALKVQIPGSIRAYNGPYAPLDRNLIRAYDGLSIKDEERCGLVLFPLIQVIVDMSLNTGQAT